MEYIDAKRIVRKATPNWDYLYFDYSMDLYRGCNHGCIYCYARSSYYEKTDDFSCIRAKKDALRIVRDELLGIPEKGIMLTGGMSDPFNSAERELLMMRHALELLNALEFGACIITKSSLVARDADILSDIKEHSPAHVNFSVTCADDEMSRKLEPFAPASSERFQTIEKLSLAGITTGVLIDPVVPFLTDTEKNISELVKKAKDAGASYCYMSPSVTMSDIQREYFLTEAEKFSPGFSEKFSKRYKSYYRCYAYYKQKLSEAFVESCEKEQILYNMRTVNQRMTVKYGISVLPH